MISFNMIKQRIESVNYKLLSKEYKNSKIKLNIQCPENHIFKMLWSNFKQGQRCPICSLKIRSDKQKLSFDIVKQRIESVKNYKLLSENYKNAHTKLNIQCPENHIFKMSLNNFKQGQRCPICASFNKKLSFDIVKQRIESIKNYKLLSENYKNINTKLNIRCPENHIFKMKLYHFNDGCRCPICNNNSKKLSFDVVKQRIESVKNYKLLSENYKNINTKLNIRCPENHIFKMRLNNFQQGQRCPICNYLNMSSKAEIEIQNYISKNFSIRFIKNDRNTLLNPNTGYYLELDIYLPDLNKAIEYNGTYWHSLPYQKIKDKIKQNECKKLNIDLLIIKECDFTKYKQKELNKIKKFIGE